MGNLERIEARLNCLERWLALLIEYEMSADEEKPSLRAAYQEGRNGEDGAFIGGGGTCQ